MSNRKNNQLTIEALSDRTSRFGNEPFHWIGRRISSQSKIYYTQLPNWVKTSILLIFIFFSIVGCDSLTGQGQGQPKLIRTNPSQVSAPPDYSQIIDGYMLRAEGAYYEKGQIKVHLLFSGYKGDKPGLTYDATLGDEDHTSYPLLGGVGSNQIPGMDIVDLTFDATNLPYSTTVPYLAISVDVYEVDTARKTNSDGDQILAMVTSTKLELNNEVIAGKLVGTFVLQLDKLVTEPVRSSIIAQAASTNDITVVLERVIVTPIATIVYLSAMGTPYNPNVSFSPDLIVLTAGNQGPFGSNNPNGIFVAETGGSSRGGSFSRMYYSDLYNVKGDWLLNIPDSRIDEYTTGSNSHVSQSSNIAGPWVFHFTVPPAPAHP